MAVIEEHKCPDIEERVDWIYTYADMVTLLFAFFVLLYALSQTEEERFKAVEIIKALIGDRKTNDGINEVGVDPPAKSHAKN